MSKRRALPASYVVRLYRADPGHLDALAGLVEDIEAGLSVSFRTGEELLRRLNGPDAAKGSAREPASQPAVESSPIRKFD